MTVTASKSALAGAYSLLLPYSKKYTVDTDRYLVTIDLLNQIPDIKNKKILDVGTGIGIVPLALRLLGLKADGLEYYIFPKHGNQMFGLQHINELKKVWNDHALTIWDKNIHDADFPAAATNMGVIVSEATIEHLRDPRNFLERCHSLLEPGGFLLISTPNVATLLKRLRFLLGKSPYWPIESFFADGEKFTGHWREYTLAELCQMCQLSGFKVVQARNLNALTKFKSLRDWRKNMRAMVALISSLIPGAREMNYVLAQKKF